MRGKFISGVVAGSIVGAAAGMMIIPTMDGKTRRRMRRKTRAVLNIAEGAYGSMMNWMK
jgi:gas vesicle protein